MYFPNDEGKRRLEALVEELKKKGEGRDFDCVMGLSGGLDSSYLAYLGASQWGLRIAAVHIDDGYDIRNLIREYPEALRENRDRAR